MLGWLRGHGGSSASCHLTHALCLSVCLAQVHRLVVVDEQDVVKGIVSLSDILQALMLPGGPQP